MTPAWKFFIAITIPFENYFRNNLTSFFKFQPDPAQNNFIGPWCKIFTQTLPENFQPDYDCFFKPAWSWDCGWILTACILDLTVPVSSISPNLRRPPTRKFPNLSLKTGLPFIFLLLQPIRHPIGHPKGAIRVFFRAHFMLNSAKQGSLWGFQKFICRNFVNIAQNWGRDTLTGKDLRRRKWLDEVHVSQGL